MQKTLTEKEANLWAYDIMDFCRPMLGQNPGNTAAKLSNCLGWTIAQITKVTKNIYTDYS